MERKINRKKGIVLYETIIILSIFLGILSVIGIRAIKIKEAQDLKEAVYKIDRTIDYYSFKTLENKIRYTIDINYLNKEIKISEGRNLIEKISLPKKLTYKTPYDNHLLNKIELETTSNGNLSDSRTIYILDYSKKAKYRLTTYTFKKNKILKINIYKKIKGEEITLENILTYHDSLFTDDEKSSHWKKI